MAVRKEKRIKAVNALVKAGMAPSTAARYVSMLDLDAELAPQIAELAEDMADLFDGSTGDAEDDDKPMTPAEAKVARLRGTNNPYVYKGEARPERKPTASKAAQAAAEHLLSHSKTAPPPTRRWYADEPKPLNTPTPVRQRPTSADTLAAKLRGN